MVPSNRLGAAGFDKRLDHSDYARAVRTAIAKVADEHKATPVGVPPVPVVAKFAEQLQQGVKLPVHIANYIDGSVDELLNQSRHQRSLKVLI